MDKGDKMTGKELYNLYKRIALINYLAIDEWEGIDDVEKRIWIQLALALMD